MRIFAIIAAAFAVKVTSDPLAEFDCYKCVKDFDKNNGGFTNVDDYSEARDSCGCWLLSMSCLEFTKKF